MYECEYWTTLTYASVNDGENVIGLCESDNLPITVAYVIKLWQSV